MLFFFFTEALRSFFFFFFQAEDGIRGFHVTGVQTCALPILVPCGHRWFVAGPRSDRERPAPWVATRCRPEGMVFDQRSSPSVQSASTPPRSSTANEPYLMSPARRYLLMTTPEEEVVVLMSSRPAGIVPASKSRLPLPSRTGKVHRRYSSIRSCSIRVCRSPQLPWTWISPLRASLRSATALGTSPSSSVELFHSTVFSVVEATYLGTPFNTAPTGSSSGTCGQCAAKI